MRLVFMGTPALAVPALERLASEHEIALAVTQPDKIAGRGHHLVAPPVKQRAMELNLPVAQPERARKEEFIEQLRDVKPDAIAVVAYGQILPRAILGLPPRGCINLHFSLLPRWRGAAPVQHAILAGDTFTGVTTQWMAEKLDAGDVILQHNVEIGDNETSAELFARLTPIGVEVLAETLQLVSAGRGPRLPQNESEATYAPTIRKEDGKLDWSQPARALVNMIRAFNPWPGTFCEFREQQLKVWRANLGANDTTPSPGRIEEISAAGISVATSDGLTRLTEVQAPGRPRMSATDWARGARIQIGEYLQ